MTRQQNAQRRVYAMIIFTALAAVFYYAARQNAQHIDIYGGPSWVVTACNATSLMFAAALVFVAMCHNRRQRRVLVPRWVKK